MSDRPLDRTRITKLVSTIFVASLWGAAVWVLEGAALGIHATGNALAMAEGLKTKYPVKHVDRLLSNEGIPLAPVRELGSSRDLAAARRS